MGGWMEEWMGVKWIERIKMEKVYRERTIEHGTKWNETEKKKKQKKTLNERK